MQNYQTELNRITEILLKPEEHYDELTKANNDLLALFFSVSGLDMEKPENREDIRLVNGKAIGPVWAALCIREILRTKRFIRGFYSGIKAALAKFPDRPIHILYAGTGPFATLAMPLTTVFTSSEINFTFLEINPLSIRSLEKVAAAFQAEKYISEIVSCDAGKYKTPRNKPIHMIITETMQNALQKEPQVGITLNLAPQMEDGGILIPQNITIAAALLDPKKNKARMTSMDWPGQEYYRILGKIFELNKHTETPYAIDNTSANAGEYTFPEGAVAIPKGNLAGYTHLLLFTTIQVFEAEYLTPWECSLTLPQNIMVLEPNNDSVAQVNFQYMMREKPGFAYKIIAVP
jgi:hypothetical protein